MGFGCLDQNDACASRKLDRQSVFRGEDSRGGALFRSWSWAPRPPSPARRARTGTYGVMSCMSGCLHRYPRACGQFS